jgi:hypothetical protein
MMASLKAFLVGVGSVLNLFPVVSDRPPWLRNRERVRSSRKGLYWCKGCDMRLVSDGVKCQTCGRRNGTKRAKK